MYYLLWTKFTLELHTFGGSVLIGSANTWVIPVSQSVRASFTMKILNRKTDSYANIIIEFMYYNSVSHIQTALIFRCYGISSKARNRIDCFWYGPGWKRDPLNWTLNYVNNNEYPGANLNEVRPSGVEVLALSLEDVFRCKWFCKAITKSDTKFCYFGSGCRNKHMHPHTVSPGVYF